MKVVGQDFSFPQMEEEVLAGWEKNDTFAAQNERRKAAKEFAFYDGPPFANGLPHYGHLLATTIKDAVPRYWIMRGFKVNRRFGWDCHGLPVEFEIEKREGLKGRPDILKLGIANFNELCQESVLHYTKEWKKTISRMGRWVDWDDQYRTMDRDYMETVWWVFGELYKKGLVYKGFKVVPYSPRTSSVVSNFEANQNYKDIQDPSITVKFKLKDDNAYALVWTTTPWTLPSNLALAVGKNIEYVRILDHASSQEWILAKDRLNFLFPAKNQKKSKDQDPVGYEVIETFLGEELVGKTYEPIFDFFSDHPNAFQVLSGDFIDTESGTGIVHQAPAYGEDDFFTCQNAKIDLVDPIDENGCFTRQVEPYAGQYFKDADKAIIKDLKVKGILLRQDTIVHSYPFDERTDTPLMYKAVPSWYVAVERIKESLIASNQTINWVPIHLRDGRMGTWLENARDWAISRNRFWGTPLPVWTCDANEDHVQIMSSVYELEQAASCKVTDLHLHHIQKISFGCSQCRGTMRPVSLVFDCWFESGSMPYAQMHYPFEGSERFEKIFPADFVAEGLDQTRGWFYTLNVLSNALFGKPAFKNVIVNGVILDENGKKMSKRHRNYTPPDELIAKYGADSVRLYMLNSPLMRAEDLIFSDQGVKDITRSVILPLWNAYSFLSTYANADNWQPDKALREGYAPECSDEMDRWIISRLQSLISSVATHMEAYKLYLVVPQLVSFIEDLTNWYIRLNRRRFWGDANSSNEVKLTSDQQTAYSTLFHVLLQFSKIFAPFAPFIADQLYQNLLEGFCGEKDSVHLCDMPLAQSQLSDYELEQRMELLRTTVNLGRSLRQQHKIKIRQVLPELKVITRKESDREVIEQANELLKRELNIKEISFTTDEAKHVRLSLKPNLRRLGSRLGKSLQSVRLEIDTISQSHAQVSSLLGELENKGHINIAGFELEEEDLLIERGPLGEHLIATGSGVTVLLNTHLTEELISEGYAREIVNRIQNLRKDSQLNVSDRVRLQLKIPERLVLAVRQYQDYILSEVLGVSLEIKEMEETCDLKFTETYKIDDMSCTVALEQSNIHS